MNLSNATNVSGFLSNCYSLRNLEISNIKLSGLNLSTCEELTHESLMNVVNALQDFSTDTEGTHTIVFGATNVAKLSDEELAIGQNKGWTIS